MFRILFILSQKLVNVKGQKVQPQLSLRLGASIAFFFFFFFLIYLE